MIVIVVDQTNRFSTLTAHCVHYRPGPTFILCSGDLYSCCCISVDCRCSRDLLHLQEI